jgi:hypothetical protein
MAHDNDEKNNSFPAMFNARAELWRSAYDESHHQRVADYVTIAKRNRGDYFGSISSRVRLAWNGRLGKGLVTYPVIPRAIRSKTATAISTDIRLDFKPSVPLPEKEAGVQSAENIYGFIENLYWTERLETAIAQLGQFGGFMGVKAEVDDQGPHVGSKPVMGDKWLQKGYATFGCSNCGSIFEPEEIPGLVNGSGGPESQESLERPEGGDDQDILDADTLNEPEIPESSNPKPAISQYSTAGVNCPRCQKPTLVQDTEEDYEMGQGPTDEIEKIMAAHF